MNDGRMNVMKTNGDKLKRKKNWKQIEGLLLLALPQAVKGQATEDQQERGGLVVTLLG